MNKVSVIVLAAGKGTRMGGNVPKVLLEIAGKPIIFWTLELLKKIKLNDIIIVTGYKSNLVKKAIIKQGFSAKFVSQGKMPGTAGAVRQGLKEVSPEVDTVLVLYGDDSALYKPSTMKKFISFHLKNDNFATLLSTEEIKFVSSGRFVSDIFGNVIEDYTQKQITKKGINQSRVACGAFCFKKEWLATNLKLIKRKSGSTEYPLLGITRVGVEKKEYTKSFLLTDPREWNSVNTRDELREANRKRALLG